MPMFPKAGVLALAATLLLCGPALAARDQIRIVGSSTVYPFASYVAEEFGATTKFKTPIVESTGSGGGHKLFGAGLGDNTPDITDSSRPMKRSECETAKANGVTSITEVTIGYDGIVIAQNIEDKPVDLTVRQLALAVLAEVPKDGRLVDNPYKLWSDIDPKLPKRPLLFYGPPTSSGTRDAFTELVLQQGSEGLNAEAGKELYSAGYSKIRQDGVWVDSGENDNLIVQKLTKDKDAFGIFGYSFLEENQDRIQGATIAGVKADPQTISSFKYPIARSLYFYVKNGHVGTVPGIREYVEMFMGERMIGDRGLLKRIGLVPLTKDQRQEARQKALSLTPLRCEELR